MGSCTTGRRTHATQRQYLEVEGLPEEEVGINDESVQVAAPRRRDLFQGRFQIVDVAHPLAARLAAVADDVLALPRVRKALRVDIIKEAPGATVLGAVGLVADQPDGLFGGDTLVRIVNVPHHLLQGVALGPCGNQAGGHASLAALQALWCSGFIRINKCLSRLITPLTRVIRMRF